MIALALLVAAPLQDHSHAFPGGEPEPAARAQGCGRSADEITICGDRDQSGFRLRALPERYREQPPRPELALPGGGTARAEAVQRGVGGVSVPSAMVTVRIPLGRRPRADAEAAPEDK